jgi:hypothetical protein
MSWFVVVTVSRTSGTYNIFVTVYDTESVVSYGVPSILAMTKRGLPDEKLFENILEEPNKARNLVYNVQL